MNLKWRTENEKENESQNQTGGGGAFHHRPDYFYYRTGKLLQAAPFSFHKKTRHFLL